jgi:hypothetical protein
MYCTIRRNGFATPSEHRGPRNHMGLTEIRTCVIPGVFLRAVKLSYRAAAAACIGGAPDPPVQHIVGALTGHRAFDTATVAASSVNFRQRRRAE